jgi:hypothetical protein
MATELPSIAEFGLTPEVARAQLAKWVECAEQVLINQRWKVGDTEYVRADLDAINRMIEAWHGRVLTLTAGAARTGGQTKVIRHGW